jgi:hypothetical protein
MMLFINFIFVLGIDNKNKIYEEHHETSVDLPIIESVQKLMDYCAIGIWRCLQ